MRRHELSTDPKPRHPLTPKFTLSITIGDKSNRIKFIISDPLIKGQHIRFLQAFVRLLETPRENGSVDIGNPRVKQCIFMQEGAF
jgi:hypothetical protein